MSVAGRSYVHGYDPLESTRLQDQATTLSGLLHSDTSYPAGSSVLEVGCGVGAQTITLARNSSDARITSIDVSAISLEQARGKVERAGMTNVQFQQADIFALPFGANSFDHLFVCFVLEHLSQPAEALSNLKRVLRPDGTITVIEGDHGSAYFYPESEAAQAAIDCQIELQRAAGGNARIGRQLYPLLRQAGFQSARVFAAHGLRRFEQARTGRGIHQEDVHGDDRGRSGAGNRGRFDRPGGVRRRN